MITGGSRSGKTNALLTLINKMISTRLICMQKISEFLINKGENAGIKHLHDPNAHIECSNAMDEVYDNVND